MESTTLGRIVSRFDQAVGSIAAFERPPLGPSYKSLSQDTLHESLVAFRALNTYEVPGEACSVERKHRSITTVLHRDSLGLSSFDYATLPRESRRDFLLSKSWLHEFFKGFKHEYLVRFPTGEGFISSKGLTDLYHKLANAEFWEVSPDLVSYLVEILIRDRALLAVVKERFKVMHGVEGQLWLKRLSKAAYREDPNTVRRRMVHFYIRATIKLNRVSRVTTVPKNTADDRVITCESLWTMVCQLSFASSLRSQLRRKLGITLETLQGVHRALIRSGKATIDLSKASDSNFISVLRQLWPQKLVSVLERMRTGIFDVGIDGEYHPLNMFAPMGCGCTFEVMTLTLLAHARILDPGASVFGDDIIISSDVADSFIRNLQAQGWKINEAKTFTTGHFRESCGAFCDLRSQKFLLSYEWHRPTNLAECYVLAHKVLHLIGALPRGEFRTTLVKLYTDLHFLFPRDSLREIEACDWRPTAGLRDDTFAGVAFIVNRRSTGRRTQVTRILSKYWFRQVTLGEKKVDVSVGRRLPKDSRPTAYYCFMRRGVYEPHIKFKRKSIYIDHLTGTPVTNVPLYTVL